MKNNFTSVSQLIENWEAGFEKGITFDDDTLKYSRWELTWIPDPCSQLFSDTRPTLVSTWSKMKTLKDQHYIRIYPEPQ